MPDPLCRLCGDQPCTHAEQGDTEDELEIYRLRNQLRDAEAEVARLEATADYAFYWLLAVFGAIAFVAMFR